MIHVHLELQNAILKKERARFYSQKRRRFPDFFDSPEPRASAKPRRRRSDASHEAERLSGASDAEPCEEVSHADFEWEVQRLAQRSRGDASDFGAEEIGAQWKEVANKVRLSCRLDFKFEPDKYRVGSHSFRYTYNKNEVAWNTALKFLFNNAKKLIVLQERLQSLSVFVEQ